MFAHDIMGPQSNYYSFLPIVMHSKYASNTYEQCT